MSTIKHNTIQESRCTYRGWSTAFDNLSSSTNYREKLWQLWNTRKLKHIICILSLEQLAPGCHSSFDKLLSEFMMITKNENTQEHNCNYYGRNSAFNYLSPSDISVKTFLSEIQVYCINLWTKMFKFCYGNWISTRLWLSKQPCSL